MHPRDDVLVAHGAPVLGCKKDGESEAAKILGVTVTDQDRVEANEIFTSRCAPCHGTTGAGDGPTARALTPKPRNFQEASWQASVATETIVKITVEGGPAVGKNAVMPANPDLANKKGTVAALAGRVRGFGR
jgi:mono/diheme cytochrome c family protein